MNHRYDWSKLDAGWRFEPRSASVRADALVHTTDRGTDRHFAIEELEQGIGPTGMHTNYWRMLWPFAIDQLAKCRIPAPDMATVTELRPVNGENGDVIVTKGGTVRTLHTKPDDEYDWSRLDGSGWRHAMEYITDGTWCFWYTNERTACLQNPYPFSLAEAEEANNSARRLVAKCKRDWRDEVKQACEGLIGFTVEWYSRSPHAALSWRHTGDSSAITAFGSRTLEVSCNTERIEHVLTMSLIIERLKKLGWGEA